MGAALACNNGATKAPAIIVICQVLATNHAGAYLAAKQSESGVDDALRWLMDQDQPISFDAVEVILMTNQSIPEATEVQIDAVGLSLYDSLLQAVEVN